MAKPKVTPDQAADQVLREAGPQIPVPVEEIVRAHALTSGTRHEGPEVGFTIATSQGPFVGVNLALVGRRRRFVFAHQLGHAVMHRPGTIICNELAVGTAAEAEASQFAIALLLPPGPFAEAVNERLGLGRRQIVTALVREFDVPETVVTACMIGRGFLAAA